MRKLAIACVLSSSVFFTANRGTANDKVTICHNNHEITVSINALPAHQAHGDQIGSCGGIKPVTEEIW